MELEITLDKPINGYFDFGPKTIFYWKIGKEFEDGKSRVGSWEANYYFEVKTGKTTKQTLSNALRSISSALKKKNISFKYEYIN